MKDTNQLPPLPTPKFTETIRGVPCITVTEHEHLMRAYALQARAQVQGDPSWWMRETDEGAEWTDTAPLVLSGWTPLYTTPQAAQATQTEVTDGIRPEDFTVDVVVKPMGGFAPVNTQGVRVTHKPTGISVTCDAARSQHTNRHQAIEKLSAILATPTAQAHPAEVTDEQIKMLIPCGDAWKYEVGFPEAIQFARAILALRPAAVPMTEVWIDSAMCLADAYADACFDQGLNQRTEDPNPEAKREKLFEHLRHHGITAQPKKETP